MATSLIKSVPDLCIKYLMARFDGVYIITLFSTLIGLP
jgi:hypothetical protein